MAMNENGTKRNPTLKFLKKLYILKKNLNKESGLRMKLKSEKTMKTKIGCE